MTTAFTLLDIPFQPDFDALSENLRIKKNSPYLDDLKTMLTEAQSIARPKAFYRVALLESVGDDYVAMDGLRLTSRVLRVNLGEIRRVFLFAATGGVELDAWVASIDDMLYNYYAHVIAEAALRSAVQALYQHIDDHFQPGPCATMNPGSLTDWPITQQKPLFALLGPPVETIGIKLLDSMIMHPVKSVSGLRFATDTKFESCMLCPLSDCPNRRAPYDAALYARKYSPVAG